MEKHYNKSRVNGAEKRHKDALIKHIGWLWKKVLFSTLPSLHSQIDFKTFDGTQYVHLFGSSATGLDEKGADIDLFLTTPAHLHLSRSGEWEMFEQLSHELKSNVSKKKKGVRLSVTNIFHCTVPIIKIVDQINDILVDISFGKSHENEQIVKLLNTLCGYNEDIRIRMLIIMIKYWAKQRDLIDAKKNKLSSFGFVLIVIRYLQSQHIVPWLRKKKKTQQTVSICANDVELMTDGMQNKNQEMTLAQLAIGFFEFYGSFDYEKQSISLFKQKVIKSHRRYRDLNGYKLNGNKCCFVIEDP
eukprot:427915_1